MSFNDFVIPGQERIIIDPAFSLDEKNTILAAMRTAYEGSPTAKTMLDEWFVRNNNTYTITINYLQ